MKNHHVGFGAALVGAMRDAAMSLPVRVTLLTALVVWLLLRISATSASTSDYSIAQVPLYLSQQNTPLMMLVMSRDEQLFNKAYSDYTNLQQGSDGDDGQIDTTYDNTFDYAGYFGSDLCYTVSNGVFSASAQASAHKCSGAWSGNFLNWVTMSRLDILRYVLYGGKRRTDTAKNAVLERAAVPDDLHAWVKVYSGSDIGSYVPKGTAPMSFCNATKTQDGTNALPKMRVASGSYTEWASTAQRQCDTQSQASDSDAKKDVPAAASVTDYSVLVNVCGSSDENLREDFCRGYGSGGSTVYKPSGLLQEYGENGKLKFGMVSGSYSKPRAGGVLRRNIGLFAGNGTVGTCASGDEVNLATGVFCSNSEGIVNAINNFKLTQWSGSSWKDCSTYGILNRDAGGNGYLNDPGGTGGYKCSAWGNPLAEMYAEALRYISGEATATTSFVDSANDIDGLTTKVGWKDPYGEDSGNSYCATCNILVLSSGSPSFDGDLIPAVTGLQGAVSATNQVGSLEGINGGNYFAGRVTAADNTTYADYCKSLSVAGLGSVMGICPDSPSVEGTYAIAGLAYAAKTQDIRSAHVPDGRPEDYKNTVNTYAIQLAESLPSFSIPAGAGSITLSPLCQSNNNGSAKAANTGWRTCFLGSVGVGATTSSVGKLYKYGRSLEYDGTKLVAGSYKLTWEDSLWGNDHDQDAVAMLTFCVGNHCSLSATGNYNNGNNICWNSDSAACNTTTVASNEVVVRLEVLSAYAGNALLNGFTVTGSDNDATYRELLRPGGSNGSILTSTETAPTSWGKPKVYRFKPGSGNTGVLESPLWYAAKYGGFDDKNNNGTIDAGEWDSKVSGTPDGYFLARDPSALKERLGEIFDNAAQGKSSVSGGSSGPRVSSDSFSVYADFNSGDNNDWTGDVIANAVGEDGVADAQLWSASEKLSKKDPSKRVIVAVKEPTTHDGTGAVATAVQAQAFGADAIPGTADYEKLEALGFDGSVPDWFTDSHAGVDGLIEYLRGEANEAFRVRSSVLGDIVNSSPVVAMPDDDYGYTTWKNNADANLKALGAEYQSYLTSKAGRTSAVYVGANDGMVHAFDGDDGDEFFAFIPSSSRQHMAQLANPEYSHQYYVDGLLTAGDAYYSGGWKTVLVGSTGGGGAVIPESSNTLPQGSVFALDVSSPANFDEAGDDVLWELSAKNDADLGHVLGSAAIVPVQVGSGVKFVALFGNGVNSVNGLPVLFVVDVATGELIGKLKAPAKYSNKNGLINIAAVSLDNSSGIVDTVYGGDMQGHIWKFDLSSSNPSSWEIAYDGEPLFTASITEGVGQPITGNLEVTSGVGGNGAMIFFGTGSYFADNDPQDTSVQSLYAIWDNLSAPISGRDQLVGQSITGTSVVGSYELGTSTTNSVNYIASRGWYMDLPDEGERHIGTPTLEAGIVTFTTSTPQLADEDCEGDVVNAMYRLNVLTGAGAMSGIMDAEGNVLCEGNCAKVTLTDNDNGPTAPAKTANVFLTELTAKAADGSDISGQCVTTIVPVATGDTFLSYRPCGRQSWRQLR